MLIGFADRLQAYIRDTDIPARFVGQFRVLYTFLLNKWYFDELYNVLFVRPAFALGRFFWKRGDEGTIDRFGPNGVAALVVGGNGAHRAAPVGLSLHLCAGDAARPRRGSDLGDGAMNSLGFPILTLMLAMPLVAALACLFDERRTARAGSRWRRRWSTSCSASCSGRTIRSAARNGSSSSICRIVRAASPGRSASTASR